MAERVGFEPTVTTSATTVFETAPIGRSGTSPQGSAHYTLYFIAGLPARIDHRSDASAI